MGKLYRAECTCGYKSGQLFLQCGMITLEQFFVPALCKECKIIVVVNYLQNPTTCPNCSKKIVLYNELAVDIENQSVKKCKKLLDYHNSKNVRDFIMWDTFYLCPKCGKYQLVFKLVGFWD